MEKSTPKEKKTRAKAAVAPEQPEKAAEEMPQTVSPSSPQETAPAAETASAAAEEPKRKSPARKARREQEQETFFENAQPDLLVVPSEEPVGAVSFGPPEDDDDDGYGPAPEPISPTYTDPAQAMSEPLDTDDFEYP